MDKKKLAWLGSIAREDLMQKEIKKFLKDSNSIVYGARSINAQTGILTRDTKDWDAFNKNPKKTANKLQKKLDGVAGGDYFFSKPAMHKGTWKVKGKGADLIADTIDDVEVADFSKPEKKVPFKKIDGIKYRVLKEEIKAKQNSVNDPEFEFRHEKDRRDLNLIKNNNKIKRLMR